MDTGSGRLFNKISTKDRSNIKYVDIEESLDQESGNPGKPIEQIEPEGVFEQTYGNYNY